MLQVHSELEWAAVGAARFYTLCRLGYYGRVGCDVCDVCDVRNVCDVCNVCLQVRWGQRRLILSIRATLRGAVVRGGGVMMGSERCVCDEGRVCVCLLFK